MAFPIIATLMTRNSTIDPECCSQSSLNKPKRAHVTSLLTKLHWVPVAARIKFKALTFDYRATSGTAPSYLNSLLQTYVPSRNLPSASKCRLVVPSQRGTKSRTFTMTVPYWWNDLPNSTRASESVATFKKLLKMYIFRQHLIQYY